MARAPSTKAEIAALVRAGEAMSRLVDASFPHLSLDVSIGPNGFPELYALTDQDGNVRWCGPTLPTIEDVEGA